MEVASVLERLCPSTDLDGRSLALSSDSFCFLLAPVRGEDAIKARPSSMSSVDID